MNCLFCKIVKKEIPTSLTYEDEKVIAFPDIDPQAPIHQLIIPRHHIATLNELTPKDYDLVGQLFKAAQHLSKVFEIQTGYRTVINCEKGGGQSVFHLHLHLLGGREFHWPPG